MLFSFGADERAAMQFDDLASALDAGLPLAGVGGDPAAGERAVHAALAARHVRLTPIEDAVLLAASAAGRITAALRARAAQRRQRAEFARELWAGLRYPLFLLLVATLTSLLVAAVIGHAWVPTVVGLVLGLVAVGAVALLRGLRTGSARWLALPWFGRLAAGLGELPYLETLHALYASGTALVEAHAKATATVGVTAIRLRLRAAEAALREGRPLTEALAEASALHPETRQLIASGERAGQLEEALGRALARRREVGSRDLRTTLRWLAGGLYGFAMLTAAWLIVDFYLGFYGRIYGR